MANLPLNASLLKNVVTNVPGFYLDNRFFFVPGFPSMAQSMIVEALDKLYPQNESKYRLTMSIHASENDLINTMKTISTNVDMSSLPIIEGEKRFAVISISGYDQDSVNFEFKKFIDYCEENKIKYELKDIKN